MALQGGGERAFLSLRAHASQCYLFAATDLDTVLFEALTAPSVPTRLAQVAQREGGQPAADAIHTLPFDQQQQRTDSVLTLLPQVFEHEWDSVVVEAESDDYFDAVFVFRAPSVTWIFNMNELRGRQPLAFVGKHLLSPLALLLAQDRGVETPSRSAPVSDVVGAVVSDPGVARAIRRITGGPSACATPVPPTVNIARATSPVLPKPSLSPSPTPKRPATRAKTPPQAKTPVPLPDTPERAVASDSLPPLIPPSSPTPSTRKVYDYAAGIYPSSDPPRPGDGDTDTPVQGDTTAPASTSRTFRSPPPPSSPSRQSDMADEHAPASALPDIPSSTLDPLLPTLEKKKKKKRDKKEEETLEEMEVEKRRAEMKRRMATGGGGGRLGRRRL